MTLESTDSVTRAMVKSGLRICGSADVHIDKLELNFIFRLRASVRVRVWVGGRVSISNYLIANIKLRIGNVFTNNIRRSANPQSAFYPWPAAFYIGIVNSCLPRA